MYPRATNKQANKQPQQPVVGLCSQFAKAPQKVAKVRPCGGGGTHSLYMQRTKGNNKRGGEEGGEEGGESGGGEERESQSAKERSKTSAVDKAERKGGWRGDGRNP